MKRNPNHRIPSHLIPEQEKRIIEPIQTALGRARTLTERKLTRDVAQIDQPTQRATQVGCRLAHAAADLAEAMAAGADQRQQGVGLDGAAHVVQEDGAVLAFARLVDLVGALARPLAAGAGTVPGAAELVGRLW